MSVMPNNYESGCAIYDKDLCNMEVEGLRYDNLSPSYTELPMEIILNIFRYLNFYDIKSASLACRRWCQASQDSEFQTKVQLKFSKIHLSDNSFPGTLFLRSFRPFPNIYLFGTTLGSVDNFFSHIGSTVEHIIIKNTYITEKQLIAILRETPNLKALTLIDCFSLFETEQFFELETNREALASSLRTVKDISFAHQDLLDTFILRLTSITSNLERLNIYGNYLQQNLTFKVLLNGIENHVTTLKELKLHDIQFDDWDMRLLANIKGLDLRKIEFSSCRQWNSTGLVTFLKSQKNLVELNLSESQRIDDRCVEVICEHLTNLEVLKLRQCHNISDNSITGVSKLKRLKVLDISYCCYITNNGIQEGVAKAKNHSLLELYLSGLKLPEDCLIQCAENLPNLRVFDISCCVLRVPAHVVQAINKNLIRLRFLRMEGCVVSVPLDFENLDKIN